MCAVITLEEVGAILDEIAEELPKEFYRELNGGVVLLPQVKLHPSSLETNRLYVLGEYHHDPRGLGRYIAIYYGSFVRAHGHETLERQEGHLRDVLCHEFTHHMESLAGERGLEIKDAVQIAQYRQRFEQ